MIKVLEFLSSWSSDQIRGIWRHILTFIGGALVSFGLFGIDASFLSAMGEAMTGVFDGVDQLFAGAQLLIGSVLTIIGLVKSKLSPEKEQPVA